MVETLLRTDIICNNSKEVSAEIPYFLHVNLYQLCVSSRKDVAAVDSRTTSVIDPKRSSFCSQVDYNRSEYTRMFVDYEEGKGETVEINTWVTIKTTLHKHIPVIKHPFLISKKVIPHIILYSATNNTVMSNTNSTKFYIYHTQTHTPHPSSAYICHFFHVLRFLLLYMFLALTPSPSHPTLHHLTLLFFPFTPHSIPAPQTMYSTPPPALVTSHTNSVS